MITAKKVSEELNLNPYKCYMCRGVLGLTSHNKLFIGAVVFLKHVTFECGYCNKITFWKPSQEKLRDIK